MGWGDLGVYGNPASETPNLDRMAEEGIQFTDFYTGSAICSPCELDCYVTRLPLERRHMSVMAS